MAELTDDPDEAARRARALLEQTVELRVDAVRNLVAATNEVDMAEQAAREATENHSKVWNRALLSGWSEKDLRASGARPPVRAGARRAPRRTQLVTGASTTDQ